MKDSRHQSIRTVLVPDAAGRSAGEFVRLEKDHLHHFVKVLRLNWGTPMRVVDGEGTVFEATLEEQGAGGVHLLKKLETEPKPPALELGICLPKAATMEWVVEKAVECGATAIIPIVSSRSVIRPDPKETQKYVVRWQKMADEALEQSERAHRVQIHAPVFWADLYTNWKACDFNFAFVSETHEQGDSLLADSWKKISASAKNSVRIVIGCEGGFSADERENLRQLSFEELSLGKNVLRVETAATTALSYFRLARSLILG